MYIYTINAPFFSSLFQIIVLIELIKYIPIIYNRNIFNKFD